MGEYCNIKFKKLENFLKWLRNKSSDIGVKRGGKHNIIVKYTFSKRPFPLPIHDKINKFIKDFMEIVTQEWGICTKEEFDERMK